MQDKQEILKSFLTLLDKTVSKEEYLAFSKTLMDFVVKIEKNNGKEFDGMWKKINSEIEKLDEKNDIGVEDVKKTCRKIMDDMMAEHKAKMKEMDDKKMEMKNGENGKDADEEKIMEMVLEKIPPVKELQPETGEKIVEKINTLPIEEEYQIGIEHIKGIEEYVKQFSKETVVVQGGSGGQGGRVVKYYDLSDSLNGVLTTFSLPAFYRIIDVKLSSLPVLRQVTDYTIDGSLMSITFTSQVQASTDLSAGQSLLVIYSEA
jgi:hypothetical protein